MAEKTRLEKEIDELGRITARKEELAEREKALKHSILHQMEHGGMEEAFGTSFKASYVEESVYPSVDSSLVKAEFGDEWLKFAKWVERKAHIRCYPLKKKRRKSS